jgi:hypothetical protein
MPIALRRHFSSGQRRPGTEAEPIARLAKILAGSAILVAGAYFAFVYLLTSR